ncbi:MAG: glycosyltransferase family 2 protein [Bryobacteraceae bacterium]|nr:glycosyltransferase family 2 protein [Bryobacteraceae bacterium]MDW8380185.1 glycosyltransferase family 2 protein [Bryobacterales bacterium]
MLAGVPLIAFLAANHSSPWSRLQRGLFDDTFAGIHSLAWFDYAILIPYFTVLTILSIYGLHRYYVIREYFKHKSKLHQPPLRRFERLPRVTIQLPLYNERFVVQRLLENITQIDYPRELLQIQVLDDSTDETHPFTERLVNEYRAQGYPIEYHHRTNRHGFKAGALQEGLKTATGEFVAIFDADFLVPKDFLHRTIHYFTDPKVGVVQTRWTYLNRHYNVLTEVQAMLLDGHFALEHPARFASGAYFNFNGTAGILRVKMIEDAGGWQHDTLTEDSDLSYRAQLKGWRFVYVPSVECPSELPVDTHGFQVQQFRWAKGLMQVALKLLGPICRSNIPLRLKAEAFCHLTPNISYPLMIVVSALMLPVMIVRFYVGWIEMLLVDLPLVIASFWSICAFYVIAQRELYPNNWKRAFVFLPALMSAGVALTLSNTTAVLEAIRGKQTSFVRTPKFAIADSKTKIKVDRKGYRSRAGLLPWLELAAGSYFLFMVLYAIDTFNFLAVPILLLFVGGYYWAGFSTLWEEYQNRQRWEAAQKLEAESAF